MSHDPTLRKHLSLASLPPEQASLLRRFATLARHAGGRLLLVGGAVRDLLRGETPGEFDLEVFGIRMNEIPQRLQRAAPLIRVGRAFPVFKVKGHPIDIAVPRREWKTGQRHTDFGFEADPHLDFATAARRRDFTCNAIGWDPLSGELLDPYQGIRDMDHALLRHTSDQFGEDALRVLRGMQFAARFNWNVAPETIALCRTLEQTHLAEERIFEEWKKLLLQGTVPSRGLFFLADTGWLRFYPELEATVSCPQDPRWHPEGSVWRHTCFCLDAFARERLGDPTEDLIVGLAVLCHDLGKPATTQTDQQGSIHSYGHEKAGIPPTRTLLQRLTREKSLIEAVEPLVATHMRPRQLYNQKSGSGAIRRLAVKVGRLDRLLRVCRADSAGRPPLPPGDFAEGEWLLARSETLNVSSSRPQPLVRGRDLIKAGFPPGPQMGPILNQLFDDQLDEKFATREDGIKRATKIAKRLKTQAPLK